MLKEHACLGVSHGNVLFTFLFTEVQMEDISLSQLILSTGEGSFDLIKKKEKIECLFLKLMLTRKSPFRDPFAKPAANCANPVDINIFQEFIHYLSLSLSLSL